MSLSPGTRLGPYEIVAPLGAGGMGEVYRATDSNLKRSVAIKVLPASVAGDADRLARFQREAEVLAALNHPNIAAIYGLEKTADLTALVMELVEGQDLSALIGRGPIALSDALPIAKQIAEALEAAHDQGIVHRDLKPANVKVRADGTVKVLDFGLAKAMDPIEASGASAMNSPTLTARMTQMGMILGTAAYMAPEQARGKAVDRRADIWAFGVVLFEMLTGRRLFDGEEASDTLASVLKTDPNWATLPADTPPALRRLIQRCLKKEPRERLQSIGDARIEIAELQSGAQGEPQPAAPNRAAASGARPLLPWALAAVCLPAAAVLAVLHFRAPAPVVSPEIRAEIVTPPTGDPISFALSPDGRSVAFVASGDGLARLWLRRLDSTTAQPIAGTEGAATPFWSPESRSIGFFAEGQLKRVDIDGGVPQTLTAAVARGGTWNADGIILFTRTTQSTLSRISASGGLPSEATKLGQQSSHRWPQFLPDGKHFIYLAQGSETTSGIFLGTLDSAQSVRLIAADTAAVFHPAGWLLWVRTGALVAQRFDPRRLALSGDPVVVADGVATDGNSAAGAVSTSAMGLLAYRSGTGARRQLQWFDRAGKSLGMMAAPDESGLSTPRLSPDGRRVVVWRSEQGNADIWVLDGVRKTRLTFDPAFDRFPVWSPDGTQIAFDSSRHGKRQIYVAQADRPGSETLLLDTPIDKTVHAWSADGQYLFYMQPDPQTEYDLMVLPMFGDRKPWVFLRTKFSERAPQVSSDGRWVAYESNESGGRYEVYVRPFDPSGAARHGGIGEPAGGQWSISTAGGIHPRWRADGKELYYLAPDGTMMAVPIAMTGGVLTPGAPQALFPTRIYGAGIENSQSRQYDVGSDGRFLINTVLTDTVSPITLVMHWAPKEK